MKITAVMVTGALRGVPRMAQVAVECFLNQDYPDRELLIINQGSEKFSGPGIREIKVHKPPEVYVGIFRNLAFPLASGDLLMTWDDDDWYSPYRMSYQAQFATTHSIVMLKNRLQGDLQSGSYGVRSSDIGFMGSMLYPRHVSCRFYNIKNGSDTIFSENFEVRTVVDNPPELYVRNWHGHNLTAHEEVMFDLKPMTPDQQHLIDRLKKVYH